MQPVIITGGPGAGKTTLLNMLGQQGYRTFPEVSRTLIRRQSQREGGVLPWTDLPRFAELCLEMMGEQRNLAHSETRPVFVDRAVGDICAYLQIGGECVAPRYFDAAQGYFPVAFFCAPNRDIYVQDEERPHSFEEAEQIHRQLVATYQELGYKVAEVPWGSVEERVNWVLTRLEREVKPVSGER